jgi:hypothetical protein
MDASTIDFSTVITAVIAIGSGLGIWTYIKNRSQNIPEIVAHIVDLQAKSLALQNYSAQAMADNIMTPDEWQSIADQGKAIAKETTDLIALLKGMFKKA